MSKKKMVFIAKRFLYCSTINNYSLESDNIKVLYHIMESEYRTFIWMCEGEIKQHDLNNNFLINTKTGKIFYRWTDIQNERAERTHDHRNAMQIARDTKNKQFWQEMTKILLDN